VSSAGTTIATGLRQQKTNRERTMSAVMENTFAKRPLYTTASENFSPRTPHAQHIDIRDEYQVTHMCRLYGVSRLAVCRAVDQVGNDRSAVQDYLRSR
jgi:Protein of unknown function (DUF3606)